MNAKKNQRLKEQEKQQQQQQKQNNNSSNKPNIHKRKKSHNMNDLVTDAGKGQILNKILKNGRDIIINFLIQIVAMKLDTVYNVYQSL